MAEIVAWVIICRNIGRIVRAKGLPAGRYQATAVGLWISFEIGAVVLAMIVTQSTGSGLYIAALLGGLASLPLSFKIARDARPRLRVPSPVGDDVPVAIAVDTTTLAPSTTDRA